jgi:hypothetical protein
MKNQKVFLVLTFAMGFHALIAQEVISSSGTHSAGSGIALSWTIGEPVIGTVSNGSYTLTQGFHQSRLTSTSVDDLVTPGLSLTVYPNPFDDVLNVKVDEGDFSKLKFTLFTLEGKQLIVKKPESDLTRFDMQTYASGNYLLRINKKSGEPVKTFKIVKQ